MRLLALCIAKCASFLLRMIHRGGSFPGSLALKLAPNIFSYFQYHCPVILVSGTNGKTSTSNMICDVFTAQGNIVINNRKGDNLKEGITTTILRHTSLSGKVRGDIMVLEVDELNIPYIMKHLDVSALVVTNFFRDQLDRSKEMEQLIQKIEHAISDFSGTLILNGNDPNVVRLKEKAVHAKAVYFGCDACEVSCKETNEASEGKFCPCCDGSLIYDYYQYSHIGVFHCSNCSFQTPMIDYLASDIQIKEGSFTYQEETFLSPINSLYTIYNCMAVIACSQQHLVPLSLVKDVFTKVEQPQGRNETMMYQGNAYTLNLIKNPTGANEVLKTIELDQENKVLMIVLNDNAQDGTDVSWIYDAQFERVLNLATDSIICSGTRAYDIALRLKYAGYNGEILVYEDFKVGLDLFYQKQEKGYIIATYTALQPVRNAMRRDAS